MEVDKMRRTIFSMLVAAVTAIISIIAGSLWHAEAALPVFVGLFGAFVLQGLVNIPANPPSMGAVTFLGRRTGEFVKEGWKFLPFQPFVFGVIIFDVTKKNLDLDPETLRTPDLAEFSAPVSITYTPYDLTAYLNAKGESGVNNILDDIVQEALREWAISKTWGPQTWQEALGKRAEAINVLVNAVLGRPYDAPISDNDLARMRAGNGNLQNTAYGFTLNRLNIKEMRLKGKLAEAAEKKVVEEREREAEKVELEHIRNQVAEFVRMGYSREQALEAVQTERDKVTKTIDEKKISVSPETRDALERIAAGTTGTILEAIGRILGRGGRGGTP
jgi:regulator of protease activity HflC (stomatin/prohibitin superfamily)